MPHIPPGFDPVGTAKQQDSARHEVTETQLYLSVSSRVSSCTGKNTFGSNKCSKMLCSKLLVGLRSTGRKTPNPHYDFDVGLVFTQFLSILHCKYVVHRGHQK